MRHFWVTECLAFAVIAGAATMAFAQPRATYQACVERASGDSAHYPQRIDRDTTITGVSCRQIAGRVIFTYDNKLDVEKSRVTPAVLKEQATSIRRRLCTDPKATAMLKLVDMEYAYYDSTNAFIGAVLNRIEDCERSLDADVASESWVLVGRISDGGSVLELDRASVVREGATVRVWTRVSYEAPIQVSGTTTRASKALALREIHCTQRTERIRRGVYLGSDDRPIFGADKVGPFDLEDIVPGSSAETVMRMACASSVKK